MLVYIVSLAILLAGVALTVWPPPDKRLPKVAWVLLFLALGIANVVLSLKQDAKNDRERAADRTAAEKLQAELRSKIDGLKAQNDELLKRQADLKAQNAELQKTIDAKLPPPRRLRSDQAVQLVKLLRPHPSAVMMRHARTPESEKYAGQLSDALRRGGWSVGSVMMTTQRDRPGVSVIVQNPKDPPEEAVVLLSALHRVGIDARLTAGPTDSTFRVELYVGLQSVAAQNTTVAN